MRILLIGANGTTGAVRESLVGDGLEVDIVASGDAATTGSRLDDAIVIDAQPPVVDGPVLCRSLRSRGVRLPILLVSGRRAVSDRVEGLDAGADDYLTRPYADAELRARMRALLRRHGGAAVRRLSIADLTLDPMTRQVFRRGRRVPLTGKEFRLLEYLMRHAGRSVPRQAIGEQVWGPDWDGLTNVIDVFVCRLRKKLEPDGAPRLLHPVRGVGYRVASDAD
jgi:two-component system response regulator MprA